MNAKDLMNQDLTFKKTKKEPLKIEKLVVVS